MINFFSPRSLRFFFPFLFSFIYFFFPSFFSCTRAHFAPFCAVGIIETDSAKTVRSIVYNYMTITRGNNLCSLHCLHGRGELRYRS